MRRNVGRNEPDFFEREAIGCGAGDFEVSAVDGIEGTAEESKVHGRSN